MDDREIITAAIEASYDVDQRGDITNLHQVAGAVLAQLEASGRAIVPVEATYLGGHRLYCAALPPDNGTCTCGLAVRARLLEQGEG